MTVRLPPTVRLGERVVGDDAPPYVIAEIGTNHDGSLAQAVALVHAAAAAGADAVKLQSLALEEQFAEPDRATRELYARIRLPEDWYPAIAAAAAGAGVAWSSSTTYPRAVDLLVEHGAAFVKIASAQSGLHDEVVRHAAASGLPLVVSTGMSTLADVARTVDLVVEAGATDVVLLHCVSAYPAPPELANLRYLDTLRTAFGCPVGWSDHAEDDAVAVAAVARGAVLVERHLTHDRTADGPDHHFAVEPDAFAAMVRRLRIAHAALGAGVDQPLPPDVARMREDFRTRVVAARDVAAGATLVRADLRLLRAPRGLAAAHLPLVVGATARRTLPAGTPVTGADLELGDADG